MVLMVSKKKILIISAVLAVLISFFIIFLYFYVNGLLSNLKPVYIENGTISTNISIFKTGVASYNYSNHLAVYSFIKYNIKNATNALISLDVFQRNPIMKIYLLNPIYSCFDCFNFAAIEENLSSDLSKYGLLLNSSSFQVVSILNTSEIAPDSIVILPTGLLPADIVPYSGFSSSRKNKNLIQLLNEKDTIIYVGQNFSRIIENGQTLFTNNKTTSTFYNISLATFSDNNITSTNSFFFNKPTFMLLNGTSLGAISYVNIENGTVVAFSNYPTIGWENSSALSSDLSRAVFLRFWINILAKGSFNISKTASSSPLSGDKFLFTTQKAINFTSNATSILNASYPLILINSSNGYTYQNYELPFHIIYNDTAIINMPAVVGYGDQVPVSVSISQFSTNKAFSIVAYNGSLKSIYGFPLDFFNTSYSIVKYGTLDVPTGGYYLASLVDINNISHGSAIFYTPYLNITLPSPDFKNGTFVFKILSDNQGLSNMPYTITVNGEYPQQGTVNNGNIEYTVPKGTVLNYGYQRFNISLININYTLYSYYASPPGIPSLYIEFGVAAFLILLLNVVLKPPNREDYYIDIPEIPPIKKQEITVKQDQIISIFDMINFKYKWQYMPLTPEEIKAGISSNIRENNMPISVTLQNTRRILYKLASDKKLESLDEYYIPTEWIIKSKHDTEYLVIFRKLRDFFVSHAIPFTDLDMSSEADIIATVRDKNFKLFIFSESAGVRDIKINAEEKNILIFLNKEIRLSFKDKLDNQYNDETNKLRMALYLNYLKLADIDSLKDIFS